MAETNYVPDPRGLFSFLDFGDTEAGASFSGFPAGTKIYRALLTQTGTNAPVATVLDNTLGFDVVWSRSVQGIYFGQSASVANEFPSGRTLVFCGSGQTLSNHWDNAGAIAVARLEQDDAVAVITGDASSPDDNLLFDTPIEIIIYPA